MTQIELHAQHTPNHFRMYDVDVLFWAFRGISFRRTIVVQGCGKVYRVSLPIVVLHTLAVADAFIYIDWFQHCNVLRAVVVVWV